MSILEPAALALLNNWLSRPKGHQGINMAGLWLLAAACLLSCAGGIYALIGLNTYLALVYGPVIAPLGTALASFVLASFSLWRYEAAQKRRAQASMIKNDSLVETAETVLALIEQATEGLEKPIAENPRTSVALASLAGYMAAHKMN